MASGSRAALSLVPPQSAGRQPARGTKGSSAGRTHIPPLGVRALAEMPRETPSPEGLTDALLSAPSSLPIAVGRAVPQNLTAPRRRFLVTTALLNGRHQ